MMDTNKIFFPTLLFIACAFTVALFADTSYMEGKKALGQKRYDKAIEYLNQAVREDPSSGEPYFYIGLAQEGAGRKDAAIRSYTRATERNLNSSLKEKAFWKIVLYYKHREDWENLHQQADRFLQFRDIHDVRKMRDLASEKRDPLTANFLYEMKRGYEAEESGDIDAAANFYSRALRIKHKQEDAKWALALVEMRRDNYDSAAMQLNELKAAHPDNWEYDYKLAVANYHRRKYREAQQSIDKAKKLNQSPDESFRHFSLLSEGLIYLDQGSYQNAITALTGALKVKTSTIALGSLSRAYFSTGNYQKAISFAERAVASDKNQRDANLVRLLIDLQNKSDATDQNRHSDWEQRWSDLDALLQEDYKKKKIPLQLERLIFMLGNQFYQHQLYKSAFSAYHRVKIDEITPLIKKEEGTKLREAEEIFFANDGKHYQDKKIKFLNYIRKISIFYYDRYLALLKEHGTESDIAEVTQKRDEAFENFTYSESTPPTPQGKSTEKENPLIETP